MGAHFLALMDQCEGVDVGRLLRIAKRRLTSAEILALAGTPIDLTPLPGAGKVIVVLGAMYRYNFVTTDYTISPGATLGIGAAGSIAQGNNPISLLQAAIFGAGPGFSLVTIGTGVSPQVDNGAVVDIENNQLQISTVGANAPTLGDGTLDITILYVILEF